MHPRLAAVIGDFPFSGDLAADVQALEARAGRGVTREHLTRVAPLARDLAGRFGLDPDAAETAAWLHDIGGLFDYDQMPGACLELGLEVLPEELLVPMLLHQQLSAAIAGQVFGVRDPAVLGAITCHTTLRAGSGPLDRLLFVSDKLEWDRPGRPPYEAGLRAALEHGLDAATHFLLRELWRTRAEMRVVHPWFLAVAGEWGVSAERGVIAG